MNRRDLLILGGAAIVWPIGARAQPKPMPLIGYLSEAAFRQGLIEIGYVEGQNLAIEYRWAESHSDLFWPHSGHRGVAAQPVLSAPFLSFGKAERDASCG